MNVSIRLDERDADLEKQQQQLKETQVGTAPTDAHPPSGCIVDGLSVDWIGQASVRRKVEALEVDRKRVDGEQRLQLEQLKEENTRLDVLMHSHTHTHTHGMDVGMCYICRFLLTGLQGRESELCAREGAIAAAEGRVAKAEEDLNAKKTSFQDEYVRPYIRDNVCCAVFFCIPLLSVCVWGVQHKLQAYGSDLKDKEAALLRQVGSVRTPETQTSTTHVFVI